MARSSENVSTYMLPVKLHSRPVCSLSGLRTDTSVIYLFKGTHSSFIVTGILASQFPLKWMSYGWVSSLTYKPFQDLSLTRCIKGLNLARIAFQVNQNVFYLVFYCMLMVFEHGHAQICQHMKKKKKGVFCNI